ncbi:MAG: hypothetical protein AB7P04_11805 [Bacteriovoracia bacterium]
MFLGICRFLWLAVFLCLGSASGAELADAPPTAPGESQLALYRSWLKPLGADEVHLTYTFVRNLRALPGTEKPTRYEYFYADDLFMQIVGVVDAEGRMIGIRKKTFRAPVKGEGAPPAPEIEPASGDHWPVASLAHGDGACIYETGGYHVIFIQPAGRPAKELQFFPGMEKQSLRLEYRYYALNWERWAFDLAFHPSEPNGGSLGHYELSRDGADFNALVIDTNYKKGMWSDELDLETKRGIKLIYPLKLSPWENAPTSPAPAPLAEVERTSSEN